MIVDHPHKSRFVYKAKLPGKKGTFSLISKDHKDPIIAEYDGSCLQGEIIFQKKDFPKNAKFYFQLTQALGSFFETDYYTVDQRETTVPPHGIWALIPCYNVKTYCQNVIEKTLAYVEKIIVVDDGSTDGTKDILLELEKKYPSQILFINHKKNRGKGFCLLDGFKVFKENKGEVLVALDSDSQHKPEDIPRLASAVLDGEDFVVGSRTFKNMPFKSRYANMLICLILRLRFPHAPKDTQSGYRAFSQRLASELADHMSGGRYEMEFECLLYALEQKRRVRSLPISTIYINDNKSSHFSTLKDSLKILKIFLLHKKNKYKS